MLSSKTSCAAMPEFVKFILVKEVGYTVKCHN